MKKSTKLLSVLLAVLLVFSAVPLSCVAAIVPAGVTTVTQLTQNNTLADLAENLVKALNSRKTNIVGTVLTYVDAYVKDINAYVPEGTDLFSSSVTAEQKATYLMDYLDALLAEENLNGKLSLPDALTNMITIDLNSVDGIFATIRQLAAVSGALALLGDLQNLDLDSVVVRNGLLFSAQSRSETGDLNLLYNLISFINDNLATIKKLVKGELKLGVLSSFEGDVNGLTANLPYTLSNLVYQKLLGAPDTAELKDSEIYKDWTIDDMLVTALVKLINPDIEADKAKAIADTALNTSFYGLLTTYGDALYVKYLLPLLNQTQAADGKKGLADVLYDISHNGAQANDLDTLFNDEFTFTEDEFNFADAQNGILGELNNVVVKLLNKILVPEVYSELALVEGDNSKLQDNLTKLVKKVLPLMSSVDLGGYEEDFEKYTEEFLADKELKDLAVDILKIFFPDWFKLDAEEQAAVFTAKSLPELAAAAIYFALVRNYNEMSAAAYDYAADFKAKVFDGEAFADRSAAEWTDVMLDMAADAAIFAMNGNAANLHFTPVDVAAKKEEGWGYNEFLDEITDWAIGMVKGVPAVADKLTAVPGTLDGFGPYYKLSVLLNELLDLSFFNNCSNNSFNFDAKYFVTEGLLANIYDFDLAGIVGLFAPNSKQGNFLNLNTVPMLVEIIDNLLDALFTHSKPETKSGTIAATCTEEGANITYCSKCGVYESYAKAAEPLGHRYLDTVLENSSCTEDGLVRKTCERCGSAYNYVPGKTSHTKATRIYEKEDILYYEAYCVVCEELLSEPLSLGAPPASIEITEKPEKLSYTINSTDDLDTTGLVVMARYDDSALDEAIALNTLTITGFDTSVAGKQTITVTYGSLSDTFEITIVDPDAHDRSKGDIDANGEITADDARTTLRAAVGLEELTSEEFWAADVDNSGTITADDARSILRAAVGLEDPTAW